MMRRLIAALFAFTLLAAACGDDSTDDAGTGSDSAADDTGDVASDDASSDDTASDDAADDTEADDTADEGDLDAIRVPEDFATIQEAVDSAAEGDLVLIGPGVYNESVAVETDNLVIRGTDRNEVILDGMHDPELGNGFIVFANGVAIENLTARNYASNGVFFTGDYDNDFILHGYRASYITAYNNGLYGVYAFNAEYGLIEQSYGSGHPDSAFYIGQCQPCDAVITDVVSEYNALGYSGTNAGGNLHVVNSEWMNNRIGIVPNTLDSEELAPQRSGVFAGNHVHDNGNPDTPLRGDEWDLAFGTGIILAGGNDNLVTRNLVENNFSAGIGVSLFIDDNLWLAENNTVEGNVSRGQLYDLLLFVEDPTGGALGNCFEGNTFETSVPADIETAAACGATAADLGELPPITTLYERSPQGASVPYEDMAEPGPQDNMPDAATAPPRSADVIPEVDDFDLEAIQLPSGG